MSVWRQFWARWLGPAWVLVALIALLVLPMGGIAGSAFAAPPVPAAPIAHVSDEAQVLSTSTRESLDRRLARYEEESGHQIIVWIGQTTGGAPIEDFAVEAFEQWKVGRPKLDDGLGVFAMVEDRTIRVEVGYGLEPTITDLIASRVIRSIMVPRIQQGDWDGAIVTGVEALVDTIEGAPGSLPADPETSTAEGGEHEWSFLQVAGLIIGIVVFMVLLFTNPGLALGMLFLIGRGGGGGHDGGGGSGFGGLGGRSGGGGATGRW
jgi:uncharacterized protein